MYSTKRTKGVKHRNLVTSRNSSQFHWYLRRIPTLVKYFPFLGVKNVKGVCKIMEIKVAEINAPLHINGSKIHVLIKLKWLKLTRIFELRLNFIRVDLL